VLARLLLGWPRPANTIGECPDPDGGEEAHRLGGSDRGQRAARGGGRGGWVARCGGGERSEAATLSEASGVGDFYLFLREKVGISTR
jgi:hypothetical protein